MRKNMMRCGLLFSLLSLLSLAACGGEGKGPPEVPPVYVVSGLVVDMMVNPPTGVPLEGATVATEDGSISTVTDENGFWQLIVPSQPDPFLKVTATAYAPSYNTVPVSIGITEFNLMTVSSLMFNLLVGYNPLFPPAQPKACLMMGAATGFLSMDYPQIMSTMENVRIEVSPSAGVRLTYMPSMEVTSFDDIVRLVATFTGGDNGMVATGPDGAFLVVVPDATEETGVPVVTLTGKRPGNTFMEMDQVTRPGGFVPVGVMDLFYSPYILDF